ncbi:Outer membrane autotransporter protein [Bosea sp. 62]|uniref:autotransporter outer membrane beta-barrel domain-containing protein n=2 Tax=Bosea TaxID=85413 RepID=UPI001259D89B|nr:MULTISPECIES: autotransporter domain-containing protein [unclassified Bosea (in: a-proteobacteria)]CAD5266706.1 Outer membrane autotransporter protein [Bosea sp. 21B]CAD5272632.1 Outer membrane autotransporter protein [Bosea sp. 7B]VVT56025.1 Outer membrane autotransporter barrel domain-containing protein [Bosea sp. EC-HK365B]VXB81998.1 Outer membrane autotransporter protein [Bosea sp. 29B]VXC20288.1 Outer membrane autotransporter protein [Bosea sp. 125]
MPLIDPERPEAVPARASSRGRMSAVAVSSVSLLALALPLLAGPAVADGGRGGNPEGNSNTGGIAGTDSATGAGGAGSNGFQQYAGGGGGGAGATAGGAGGLTWSHDPTFGRGGTGGMHGSVDAGLPTGDSTGSNGGNGADGSTASGGGGGGGGGWGAVVTGAGTTGVVSGTITGGNGGAGGNTYWDFGGSGGSGGTGLIFTNGSQTTTLTVNGTVQGGNGGGRGVHNPAASGGPGAYGAGGIGIVGANLSITNNGTIAGGMSGDGVTRTWAVRFTGGNNTLTFGNATSGLIGGILMDAGTLTFAQPTDATLDNEINGNGSVIKTGVGTLTLTGTNTYTGGTTIVEGKLSISAEAHLGNVAGVLTLDGGVLQVTGTTLTSLSRNIVLGSNGGGFEIVEAGNSFTVAQSLSGSGVLSKSGAGTLVLLGANSYSGGTTISGGKLSVSSDANLGDASGGLTLNGGTLLVTNSITSARTVTLSGSGGGIEVDAGRAVLWTGTITGAGGLTKSGGGTLALQNNSSYSGATLVEAGTLVGSSSTAFSANSNFTVSAGATLEVSDVPGLVATVGSLAGAGAVQLGSGVTLKAGSSNASTTFSGTISGNGALDKTGTGTLTLSGTNTYTGGTTVSGGKLVVNGSITGSVSLSGGVLGGSGTVGTVSVASGATVAPGNSIGTLNVSGNVAFASGSTYQVEVNAAGQSDRIVASGSATLSGGTVQVLAENGNYAASTNYTILTASGGVSGSFTSVTSNLAFLTPSLSYGGTNVTLTMTRNDTSFGPDGGGGSGGGSSSGRSSIAQTRNQGFIAIAAERLGVGNPVYDALISATVAEARAGFDLLSGEAHAQAVSVMIDESRLVRDTILGHLRGPLLTQPGQQVAGAFSADLPGRKGAVVMPAPVPQPRYALWGTAFGSTGNTDGDGNAASLSRRSGGALLGADLMLYDAPGSSLKVGVAGGYSQSRFDLDARLSTGKLESGHAALYASARFGQLRLDAGAAYTWSESDIRRQVSVRGFGDLLRLQRPGSVTQGFAELGYAFAFSGVALEPFAQLALIRVSTDAGTERGGAAALRILSSDQTLGFTTLGLRAEAQLGAMPLFARAMLGWRHGFGELTPQARTAFVAGTTPAQVFAARIDRDALTAEAGLDWRISQATALGLTYSAAIGERSRDHALKGRVEMRF